MLEQVLIAKSLSTFAELALGALRQWETGENGRREGRGLLFLAGMANGVRFFAPPYWKFEACARRAARNPHYGGRPSPAARRSALSERGSDKKLLAAVAGDFANKPVGYRPSGGRDMASPNTCLFVIGSF